jgi:hypothetical protein
MHVYLYVIEGTKFPSKLLGQLFEIRSSTEVCLWNKFEIK